MGLFHVRHRPVADLEHVLNSARAALLLVTALSTACQSHDTSPREEAPGTAASVTSGPVTLASASSSASLPLEGAKNSVPLLLDDPNWTRVDRIARVLSVVPCKKTEGQLCKKLTIRNEGKEDIAQIVEVRLCGYDAKGKPVGTCGYNYAPPNLTSIPAGGTVNLELLVSDDEQYGAAKTIEGEVVIARLAGAPKGRHWVNTNLAGEDRPKGGFDAAALRARSAVAVRTLAFNPLSGIARVRNETNRTIEKMHVSVLRWRRADDGALTKGGGVIFMPQDVKVGRLAPGEERDLDLSTGKEEYAKPGVVAFSVLVGLVIFDDGTQHWNSNFEPDVAERAAEDLPPVAPPAR